MRAEDVIRLPIKPLWDLVAPEGRNDFARRLGTTGTSVSRWFREGGIPLDRCDGFAVDLGFHPMSVWGDDWYDAEVLHLARREQARLRRNERNAGYRRNRRRREQVSGRVALGKATEGTASGKLAANRVRPR